MFVKKLIFMFVLLVIAPLGLACEQQYRYSTEVTSTSPHKMTQANKVVFESLLTVKSVTNLKQDNWWAIKADNVILNVANQLMNADSYEIPFAFKLNDDGMIVKFWYPLPLSNEKKALLSTLAYNFQYKRDTENGEFSDETEQETVYRYEYKKTIDKSEILKIKRSVVKPLANQLSKVTIIDSVNKITVDNCLIKQSSGHEKFEFISEITGLSFNVEYTSSLKNNFPRIASDLYNLPNELADWPSYKKPALSEEKKEKQIKELHRWVNQFDPKASDVFDVVNKLENYEASLVSLIALFSKNTLSNNSNMRLINALGVLDSEQSQLLLINMVRSPTLDANSRFRALQSLTTGSNSFSDDAELILKEVMSDGIESDDPIVANSLLPTIGIALGNRLGSNENNILLDALADELSNASDNTKKSQLLVAMGNTRSEIFSDIIINASQDTSSLVRRDSAYALGKINTASAYDALGSMLVDNKLNYSTSVEMQVIKSFANYTLKENELSLIADIADNAKNTKLRQTAIDTIITQPKEVRVPALKNLLKSETNVKTYQKIINGIHSQ